MSTHFRFEHDFDIDAKDYWDIFFSDEYNAEMYREIKMKEHKVVSFTDDGRIIRRQVRLSPSTEVPAIFKSVISDMSYIEHNVFDREKSEMEVVVEPAMMKGRLDLRGVYAVKPLGPGRCRRSFEGDAKVSIMLIGGKVEKYMIEQVRESYDIAARVTRRWIEKWKKERGQVGG